MKKLLLAMAFVLGICVTTSARDTYSRNVADLPTPALNTIKNNFKASVSLIKIDKSTFGGVDYEVILTDGTEIDFDKAGNWTEIEVPANKEIPSSVYPKAIGDYVKKNHKNAKIIGIEKGRKGYSIDITGGIEMKFDLQGTFLRYDK